MFPGSTPNFSEDRTKWLGKSGRRLPPRTPALLPRLPTEPGQPTEVPAVSFKSNFKNTLLANQPLGLKIMAFIRVGLVVGALFLGAFAYVVYTNPAALSSFGMPKQSTATQVPVTLIATPRWQYDANNRRLWGEVVFGDANAPSDSFSFDFPTDFNLRNTRVALDVVVDPDTQTEKLQGFVTGNDWQNCFAADRMIALHSDFPNSAWHGEQHVCPSLSDRGTGQTAMIGTVWTAGNHQPLMDDPHLACRSEAAVWLGYLAPKGVDIAICLAVMDEASSKTDVMVFRREGELLVTLAATGVPAGTAYPFDPGSEPTGPAVTRLLFNKQWRENPDQHLALLEKAQAAAKSNASIFNDGDSGRFLRLDAVDLASDRQAIILHVTSQDDDRLWRIRDGKDRTFANIDNALFFAALQMLCADPKTAALMDLTANEVPLGFRLKLSGGNLFEQAPFDRHQCPAGRE
jgi:hypothetical protein